MPWRDVLRALALGLLFAAPCLGYALTTAGLARTSAHDWRPEQIELLGLRWMSPGQLLALVPPGILALAAMGLFGPARPERLLAREIARLGTLVAALVLFTPLHHLSLQVFGGWMVGRVATLAFPWLAAALGLEWLLRPGRRATQVAGAVLCVVVAVEGAGRVARDWQDRAYQFSAVAQADAWTLRDTLRGRTYVTADVLGYGTAAPTLGRPLAVPPGHASPFGDFRRRQRRVHRAIATNTPECWAALFALYPDAEYIVTPAAGADAERRIWAERFPGVSPEAVRELLRSLLVLEPVREGRVFVLDDLRPEALVAGRSRAGGMGLGPRCREEP